MRYLLDTCIVSEYLRKKPSRRVIAWLDQQDSRNLYLSSLTVAELKKGAAKLNAQESRAKRQARGKEGSRAAKIVAWVGRLEKRFEGRILPIDSTVLDLWSSLSGFSEAKGEKLPVLDSLIVATALVNELVAITRNVEDFCCCSDLIKVVDPF